MGYNFDYFYGKEVEKFQFFKLPAFIVKDPRFSKMTGDAKILYGLLLDRTTGLSMKNGWFDEEGRVYIIYTIKEIMEDFGCWQGKATSLLDELTEIGLIKRVRKGLGKANRIYVMDFSTINVEQVEKPHKTKNCENRNSRIAKIANQEVRKSQIQNSANEQIQNCENTEVRNCEDTKIKSFATAQTIQTNSIQTNITQTEGNHINPIHQADQMDQNALEYKNEVRESIKKRIGYNNLMSGSKMFWLLHKDDIDTLVALMVEAYTTTASTIRIGGVDKPRDVVLAQFDQIDEGCMTYILKNLETQITRVKNPANYYMTVLYNATLTEDLHLSNIVKSGGYTD